MRRVFHPDARGQFREAVRYYKGISPRYQPKGLSRQACIKGTRIPVHQIFRMLANGDSVESLIRAYPSLQREDILACFDYAASLAEEEVTPLKAVGLE